MSETTLPKTGERYTPEMDGVIRLEHLHRYRVAALLAGGKDVLDIASGEGFGSELLAGVARTVVGVDISAEAVEHAKAKYCLDNLEFIVGNATKIPLPGHSVDLVVSFETIEHFSDHDRFMLEVKRVLRSGGVFLISSPSKAVYSDKTQYANEFHKRELYTHEFEALLGKHFPEVARYDQKTSGASIIAAPAPAPLVSFVDHFSKEGLSEARYDLILASDGPLPALPHSLFEVVDGPLQPERSEITMAALRTEVSKLLGEVHRLNEENRTLRLSLDAASDAQEKARAERDALRLENDVLAGARAKAERALELLARDANTVLNDKWWRRTRHFRRWSNSVRKLRGRPKKQWPDGFALDTYLAGPARDASPRRPAADRPVPKPTSISQRCHPTVTVVAMARNEAARAHDTLRHFCALFDRVVLIDHLSEDATAEIASGYDGMNGTEVVVLRGEDPGYYQSEYMSEVANALLSEGKCDWIFFLDFDEFLLVDDKAAFHQSLVHLADSDVIHMHWHNVSLKSFDPPSLNGADAVIGPRVSEFVKVAVNARRLRDGTVTIEQGNHAALLPGLAKPQVGERSLGILHVPFTSLDALRKKIEEGCAALDKTAGKEAILGGHWRDIAHHIDRLAGSEELARELALNYGKPIASVIEAFNRGDMTQGTRSIGLKFAQTEPAASTDNRGDVPHFTLETAADVLEGRFPPSEVRSDPLSQFAEPIYGALLARVPEGSASGADGTGVERALLAAATDVAVVVPTAWYTHIPFLFALMESLRPRRYVELGTHAGASFFAACQHMTSNGNYGECVAIDLWEGDHQAGFYDESVFENFKFLLQRHFPATGRFIRGYFSDAATSFRDGSIDLLHIDGLHTYEAVREDYETWRGKVSDTGVILFHDTNEFQTDFGVWQYFSEVRSEADASFQFRHGHGLGVMAFGTRESNPAVQLIEYLNSRPAELESYFAILGEALYDAARFRL